MNTSILLLQIWDDSTVGQRCDYDEINYLKHQLHRYSILCLFLPTKYEQVKPLDCCISPN